MAIQRSPHSRRRTLVAVAVATALATTAAGCRRADQPAETAEATALTIRSLDPPAAPGAFAPRIAVEADGLLMTWWEPVKPKEKGRQHRLMFASHQESGWSEPTVVTEGADYFANWADIPSVIREPTGSLLAHWLAKTAEETYAYSIFLARSHDDGRTWAELGKLNDDETDTEHGFVSFVREGNAVRAYWLDGRLMAEDGPMTVRSALVTETIGASELLDERVCECCPTDAVATSNGSIVAYRNRDEDEIREMYAVYRADDGWSEPSALTGDGWMIPGCPVNGPAIDHRDGLTALAWFTAADNKPRVAVGFSRDKSAMSPIVVDDGRPLGRVGLVLDSGGDAVVSWLSVAGDGAELRLRKVARSGARSESMVLAHTSGARASGIPQLERQGDLFLVSWVEVLASTPSQIRLSEIPAALLPSL